MSGNQEITLQDTVGHQFQPTISTFHESDAAFYALAIGASQDPLDAGDLQYTYELYSGGFKCFPTFATTFPLKTLEQIASIPGQKLSFLEVLHGEHYLELVRPLPIAGTITNQATISHIFDKGPAGAVMMVDIRSEDPQGQLLAVNKASIFLRGRGGFGGERGPAGSLHRPPERRPDATIREPTGPDQALLFRLASGDHNPLHADIRFAALLGFKQPILHGLCTYGYATRAVLKSFAENNSDRFQSVQARFTNHVFPGETLETEMWQDTADHIYFRSRVVERDEIVLTNGVLDLKVA